MRFDASVWGPHYWFFLHTVAESYPLNPTPITKRKYYDLLQNFPLFIPEEEMGNTFSQLLDKYPVSPYLDSRESFVRWVHFMHNKMNHRLGKRELSLPAALDAYRAQYAPMPVIITNHLRMRSHYVHATIILTCLFLIYYYYRD